MADDIGFRLYDIPEPLLPDYSLWRFDGQDLSYDFLATVKSSAMTAVYNSDLSDSLKRFFTHLNRLYYTEVFSYGWNHLKRQAVWMGVIFITKSGY